GLAFDAHAGNVDADRAGDGRTHRVNIVANLRRFQDHGDVDVPDFEVAFGGERGRPPEEIEARRVLPPRVRIGKVPPDVAETCGAENGVGDRVAHDICIRV